MSRVRRKRLNLVHQDQRRDGEDTDTEVKPEIPGMQAFPSLLQPASQSPPRCSGAGAPSEPHNTGSVSCLRDVSGGAQSTTAELATTSKITHRREAPLASRYCRRTNSAETLVTNESTESEEEEEEEEEESSPASTGLSHHLESFSSELKATVCRAAGEQSRPLIVDRLDRGSAAIWPASNTGWTSSPRGNLCHRKSTTVALEKGGSTEEEAHIQGCQEARSLKYSSAEISGRPKLRLYEEIFGNEEDRDCCRICRGSDNSPTDPLLLCLCSGSLKFIHLTCLKNWTGSGPDSAKTCELCKGRLIPDLEPARSKFGRVLRRLRRWMNLAPGSP